MQIAEVNVNGIVEIVPLEIAGLDDAYEKLHKQAPSGWAVHTAYSNDRFNNKLHDADLAFYESRNSRWFGEIFHDVIEERQPEEGETSPGEGFVPVTYTTNPARAGLVVVKTWLPPQGLYLPVKDTQNGYRFFKTEKGTKQDGSKTMTGILVPERVVLFSNRQEARKAFSEFNLSYDEISGFFRLDDYRGQKVFGGRGFDPDFGGRGRFDVRLDWSFSLSGDDWVGSRSAYAKREIVMKVGFPE